MLAKIFSRAAEGINAPAVTVEVHQSNGLPALNIVGLPVADVRGQHQAKRALEVAVPSRARARFPWRTSGR